MTQLQVHGVYYGRSNVPMQFYELARSPDLVTVTFTYDDEKGKEHHIIGQGWLTIDQTKNSWAHGEEAQIHVQFVNTPKEKNERAVNNGHDRLEIADKPTAFRMFIQDYITNYELLPKNSVGLGKERDKLADW